MPSTTTRGQIVLDALSLAARSTELKQSCNQWMNYWLLHVGLNFRFPELRKIGAPQGLAQGSSTSPLPADLGAGMAKSGLIFGPDKKPLNEMEFEEFANTNGFIPNACFGRPLSYLVDKEAGVFRFAGIADQAYTFTPVYYKTPPLLDVSTSDDGKKIWMEDDMLAVQGLIQMIYQFTEDAREQSQKMLVDKMLIEWKRELVKMGGTSRVMPSPSRFKPTRFGSYGP